MDVKDLHTYQQLYIYFMPMFTNLGFINIIVAAVRLHWFEKKFKDTGIHPRHESQPKPFSNPIVSPFLSKTRAFRHRVVSSRK